MEETGKFIHSGNRCTAEAFGVPWLFSIDTLLISAAAVVGTSGSSDSSTGGGLLLKPEPHLPTL